MSRRTQVQKPALKFSFWKLMAGRYYADPDGLQETILRSERSAEDLNRWMGAGTEYIPQLLNGFGIDFWSAVYVEGRLQPKSASEKISHRPV